MKRVLRLRLLALLGSVMLTACAPVTPSTSYVSTLTAHDARFLAASTASWLMQQYPPASSTLVLAPPVNTQANNAFTGYLAQDLQQAGFALVTPTQATPSAHHVRYVVTPLNEGTLVRLQLDTQQASAFYPRVEGVLQPAASVTLLPDIHP